MIGILQQQLEESQSTLLPPVPEVSDEEDNYSTIHEEIDLITRWLDKIDGLLFESVSKSDEIQTLESRMDRLFDWCQQHQRKSIEVKSQPSVIDSPYFTLLQREIAELEELVEGSNSKGAPVKQLHSLQNTVRSVLEQSGIRSLAELKHSEQDDHRKYDEQMTLLEAPIRAFAKELSIHFTGTSLESQLVQCLDVARELIAGSKQQIGAEEEIRRCCFGLFFLSIVNSIIVDKTKALDVVNSLNDRLMELVKSEKKEFENLLFVYKQLEKKYEEARQRSCPSCSDLQKKCYFYLILTSVDIMNSRNRIEQVLKRFDLVIFFFSSVSIWWLESRCVLLFSALICVIFSIFHELCLFYSSFPPFAAVVLSQ